MSTKRILALILTLVMCFTVISPSTIAFAEGEENNSTEQTNSVVEETNSEPTATPVAPPAEDSDANPTATPAPEATEVPNVEATVEPTAEPHEHAWGEGEVTTAATCTEAGVKTFTCECGDSYTEPIDALGHSWNEGEVTTAATCAEAGEKTFTCACGETKTEEIPVLEHAFVYGKCDCGEYDPDNTEEIGCYADFEAAVKGKSKKFLVLLNGIPSAEDLAARDENNQPIEYKNTVTLAEGQQVVVRADGGELDTELFVIPEGYRLKAAPWGGTVTAYSLEKIEENTAEEKTEETTAEEKTEETQVEEQSGETKDGEAKGKEQSEEIKGKVQLMNAKGGDAKGGETQYVAKIGDVEYATLDAAIGAVVNSSDTIILLEDAELGVSSISKSFKIESNRKKITLTGDVTINNSKTIIVFTDLTIDLAGHTITSVGSGKIQCGEYYHKESTLTIKDSTTGGMITGGNYSSAPLTQYGNGSVITLEDDVVVNGTYLGITSGGGQIIVQDDATVHGATYGVKNTATSDGVTELTYTGDAISGDTQAAWGPAEVTVGGKTYYGKTVSGLVTKVPADGTEYTITAYSGDAGLSGTVIQNGQKVVVNLNQQTVDLRDEVTIYEGHLTIKNGTVNNSGTRMICLYASDDATKAAGEYNSLTIEDDATVTTTVVIYPAGYNTSGGTNKAYGTKVTIDGTIIGTASGGVSINGVAHEGNSVIDVNGTVRNANGHAMYLAGYGITNINSGATVTGSTTGIEVRAGKLNVTGGTITGNGVPIAVKPNGSGTTTDGVGIAIAQHTTKLPITVNISGGTVKGFSALYESNPQSNSALDLAKISISVTGGKFEVINHTGNYAEVPKAVVHSQDFTGFISGGKFSAEPDAKYIAEGKIAVENTGDDAATYPYTISTAVASITKGEPAVTTYYATLADAIAAVGDGETILMLANVDNAVGMSVPSGKNFTVDFQNHTYTVNKPGAGSANTETIAFQLLAGSTIVFKNGTIAIAQDNLTPAVAPAKNIKRVIQNYANLTLDNMVIDSTYQYGGNKYPVSFNNGTSVVKDTTITADNGKVAFDVCRYASYPSVSVTVTGNSVINGDVEVSASGSDAKDGFSLTLTSGTMTGDIVVDATAATAMEATPAKAAVTKAAAFEQEAPTDYKWVDNGDGTSNLVAKVYVAQIGDVKYESLAEAISEAEAGSTVTLLADVTISQSGSTRLPISKPMTIDGDGHTITIGGRGFGVGLHATSNIDVTFKDVKIVNNQSDGRCIDTRGNIGTLTLDNTTLDMSGITRTPYNQPLTIGGNQSTTATVNIINDSKILASSDGTEYYAIITFNPVNMTIDHSTIKGWACIYAKGPDGSAGSAGSTFTITNSTLVSKNVHSGTSNAFAMLMVEDDDVTFNVTNTTINLSATGDQDQAIASFQEGADLDDVAINLGAGNNVTMTGKAVFAVNDAPVKVSGGTFTKDPSAYVADGYVAVANNDDTWTVAKAVAKIGDTYYASLKDAVAAVPADGTATTITMIANEAVVAGVTIAAGQNIVLELAGHTISGNTDSTTTYALITNRGTLTIQDSTDENKDGTGTGLLTTYISNPDTGDIPGYASNTITNNGTLTVKSGKIVNNGSGYACYAIDNQTNGASYTPVLTIDGGRMEQMNGYTYAVRMFCNSTTKTNTVTVKGGVITGGYGLWLQTPNANANKAELVINGGVLDARDGAALYVGGTKANNSEISITIKDGEIKGTGVIIQGPSSEKYGHVEISNGKIKNVQCGANVENFISGGYFGVEPAAAYIADGYEAVELTEEEKTAYSGYNYKVQKAPVAQNIRTDATYTDLQTAINEAQSGDTIQLLADIELSAYVTVAVAGTATIDLNGHSIIRPSESGNTAMLVNGNLTVEDTVENSEAAIVASLFPIYVNSGTLTLSSGIVGSQTSDYGIYAAGTATVNANGGTVKAKSWGIAMFDTSRLNYDGTAVSSEGIGVTTNGNSGQNATITINGGTITGAELGIYQPSGKLAISRGTITGKTGVYFKSNSLNITGGTIIGNGEASAYNYNGNGANYTGDALVIDSCGYPNGINDVSVSGGNFQSVNADAEAVACYTYQQNTPVTGFITGGKYSSEPDSSYVASGYKAVSISESPYLFQVGYATVMTGAGTETTVEGTVPAVIYQVNTTVTESQTNVTKLEETTNLTVTVTGTATEVLNAGDAAVAVAAISNVASEALGDIVSDAIETAGSKIDEDTPKANIVIQLAKSAADTSVTGKATYEVHPEAVISVVGAGETFTEVGTVELTNSQITGEFSFKLYALNIPGVEVKVGDWIQVTHRHSDGTSEIHGRYQVDEYGYITVHNVTSFSEFELEVINAESAKFATFGYTISLEDSINIVYNVKNLTGTLSSYKVTYTDPDTGEEVEAVPTDKNLNSYVIAKCAAKEMDSVHSVIVTYNGEQLNQTTDFSIKNYCDTVINGSYGAELTALCKATLDYGRYAQETFLTAGTFTPVNGGNDYFMNSNITVPAYEGTKTGSCDGISKVSIALVTTSQTQFIVYFKGTSSITSLNDYTVTVNGQDYTPTIEDGKIKVLITGIAAKDLGDDVTVTISNGGNVLTYVASPTDYMGLAVGANSHIEINRAFYNYYQKAVAYKAVK